MSGEAPTWKVRARFSGKCGGRRYRCGTELPPWSPQTLRPTPTRAWAPPHLPQICREIQQIIPRWASFSVARPSSRIFRKSGGDAENIRLGGRRRPDAPLRGTRAEVRHASERQFDLHDLRLGEQLIGLILRSYATPVFSPEGEGRSRATQLLCAWRRPPGLRSSPRQGVLPSWEPR